MRLKDKIAIVTGATHGIGKAIAQAYAREGAWVLLAARDRDAGAANVKAIRDAGGKCEYLYTDIGFPDQIKAAVDLAARQTGRIDVLVNNAAYLADWHNIEQADDEEWDRCYQINLRGQARFIEHVMPYMLKQKSGSIINVSSVQGLVAARNSPAYTSMKHALIGLTRNVAYDYGQHNIRCNALCPGAIRVRYSPEPGSELHTRQINKTFLGRVGEPEDCAGAAIFLAADESSYVTGAVLAVDGGWTCM
jgi:NAD(P)-dependent dehydrogenase (short-subunit alcohol dehydrogenase family)